MLWKRSDGLTQDFMYLSNRGWCDAWLRLLDAPQVTLLSPGCVTLFAAAPSTTKTVSPPPLSWLTRPDMCMYSQCTVALTVGVSLFTHRHIYTHTHSSSSTELTSEYIPHMVHVSCNTFSTKSNNFFIFSFVITVHDALTHKIKSKADVLHRIDRRKYTDNVNHNGVMPGSCGALQGADLGEKQQSLLIDFDSSQLCVFVIYI